MTDSREESKRPLQPWPWLIFALLATMISISLGFFAIAVANPDPDVRSPVELRTPPQRGEAAQ